MKTVLKTAVLKDSVTGQWKSVTLAGVLGAAHQTGEAAVPLLIGVVIDEAVRTGAGGWCSGSACWPRCSWRCR